MNILDRMLAIPDWTKYPQSWESLARSDTFFRALYETVKSRTSCNWTRLHDLVTRWKEVISSEQEEQNKLMSQWYIVRRLLWCAEQAATCSDFYRTEIDRVCFALADTPEFIERDKKWAWGCIRTFLDVPIRGRPIRVPVALVDESKGTGFLATLVLEVLDGGAGEVFHHPTDAFDTRADDWFCASLDDAWAAAQKLPRRLDVDVLRCVGRWRLLKDAQPVPEVSGRSVSGAAALGWYHALRDTVPDEDIIVLAQVDENDVRLLKGVDGVEAKTKAIAAGSCFDTIVVTDGENQHEAESTLRTLGKFGLIRVVNLDASDA